MNVFEKYPQFISSDPRTTRKTAYKTSTEFMQLRHECFFNSEILANKTVLDLGCCVGASGAWVLHNSAKFYCGVEYHADLANTAIDNLSVFDKDKWQIVNSSVEHFFETNTQTYDIIIASGIMYSFFEPIPILKNIAKFSSTAIIESVHPRMNNIDIEAESFISYRKQAMVWGMNGEEIIFNSAIPSMSFIKESMKLYGFDCDMSVTNQLKQQLPELYSKRRFGLKLVKTHSEELSQGFLSATEFPSDVIRRNHGLGV